MADSDDGGAAIAKGDPKGGREGGRGGLLQLFLAGIAMSMSVRLVGLARARARRNL